MSIMTKVKTRTFSDTWQFKPTVIPPGFKLVIDTREQLPLFRNSSFPIIRTALKHGDYSVLGLEEYITIERKQMSDFLTYIGKDRVNTANKLSAMRDFFFKALVIETNNPFDIPMWTSLSTETVRGFLKEIRIKYGVHVYYSSFRSDIEAFILDHLVYSYILLRRIK